MKKSNGILMRLKCKAIVLILFLFFILKNGRAEFDCIFEHLSTENGLSHGSVSGMLKDNRGFMWFATWDGINRYDGHNFKTYKPGNDENTNFASNRIQSIKEDVIGNIWVTNFDAKVFRLNRLSEKFDQIPGNQNEAASTVVSSIFPASNGDVWILTKNVGAFRIVSNPENNNFSEYHYHEKSTLPLPGNEALFVAEDERGNIWINTNNGIICLEKKSDSEELTKKEFASQTSRLFPYHKILCCYNDSANSYFGTQKGNLLVFNHSDQKLHKIIFRNNSPITNIASSSDGLLYLGTNGNGIFEFQPKLRQIERHFKHNNIKSVLKMYADKKGMLWVESTKAGISKINLNSGDYKHYQQKLDVNSDVRPSAQCGIMEDEQNTLWLTLKGGGFGYYNDKNDEIEYFYNKPGDPESKISNFVTCFYKDPSGVLWLSTYFKGIEKITFVQPKFRFTQPSPQQNLSIANEVRALLEDSQGLLWIATKNEEIYILDKNYVLVKKISALNNKNIGRVYTIMESSDGTIYLGTKGNGLFQLSRKGSLEFNVKHYLHNPNDHSSLSDNNIYSLLEDRNGRIWVGTYGGGINIFENGRFIHTSHLLKKFPPGFGEKVRHISEDKKGNIWLGTTDGLVFIHPENSNSLTFSYKLYSKDIGNTIGLKGNDVLWIYCDPNETTWVASLGGGLAKLNNYPDGESALDFTVKGIEEGLSSDVIFTITSDSNNNLWMSTENGIAFYNPSKNFVKSFGRYDGIENSDFSEGSIAIRADSSICFGTNQGIYSFSPKAFSSEHKLTDIVFTEFRLMGKNVSPGPESVLKKSITECDFIQLKYNQNVFDITWASLDYKLQNKIIYAYKLEGYDNNWHYSSIQNQASYNKLPPGNYVFKVKFRNTEYQGFNHEKSLTIKVQPPFWKTIWAYISYVLFIIALIEIARRILTTMLRLRNKVVIEKEMTDIKLNFFTNISHELRTPLTLILGPAKELKSIEELGEKGQTYAKLIEKNAERLLRLVNQLLDFRKIQSGKMELALKEVNLVSFTKKVCENFNDLALEKNIQFSVQTSSEGIFAMIDEEKMDIVIFNLLSNAFKFTPEDRTINVYIRESEDRKNVLIEIIDTGVGITKEKEKSLFKVFANHDDSSHKKYSGTGIGLVLSKELVQLHDGELIYRKSESGGAIFTIQLNSKLPLFHQLVHSEEEVVEISSSKSQPPNKTISTKDKDDDPVNSDSPIVLIVEDNFELRKFLHLQLDKDYVVKEAADGKEGLIKALKYQPDIILSDVMMPEMDGIELLDKIKTNFETSHIPVVLLTAKSSVANKIEGLKYGADAYLTKPFHTEQLKAQLTNLMGQRLLLRESFAKQGVQTEKPPITVTDKDAVFLNQVREIIEENLTNDDFKIMNFYKRVGMGRSKFYSKIKGLTGLSPIDFVKEYQLYKAQDLLQSGLYNVSETSIMSGFTDAGYFSKCYKERFGVSPSQVRKK